MNPEQTGDGNSLEVAPGQVQDVNGALGQMGQVGDGGQQVPAQGQNIYGQPAQGGVVVAGNENKAQEEPINPDRLEPGQS